MSGCGPDIVKYFVVEPGGSGSSITGSTGDFYVCSGTAFLNEISSCNTSVDFNGNTFYNGGDVYFGGVITACTGIHTSSLKGCSPISVEDELIIKSGLTLSNITKDNALQQVLAINPTDGVVRYMDIDSISVSGSSDSVTGGTFSSSASTLTLFRREGSAINITGFTSSGGANFGTTYFVAPDGDDSTAEIGNIFKPWQSITSAKNQAISDGLSTPLIYVYPGTYDDDELQYEGSYYFEPGVILTGPEQYHGTTGIVSVDQVTQTFVTPGNFGTYFNVPGKRFRVVSSTGNDGVYTVVSAVDSGPNTSIVVVEVIPSAISDGRISTASPIFSIGLDPSGTGEKIDGIEAFDCKVYGEVTVDIPKTIDNDWSGGFVDVYSGGTFYCDTHSITVEQGVAVANYDNGKLTLKGEYFNMTDSGYAFTFRDDAESILNFQRVYAGPGASYVFFLRMGHTSYVKTKTYVEAEEIIAEASVPILGLVHSVDGMEFYLECPNMRQNGGQWAFIGNVNSGGEIRTVGNLRATQGLLNIGSSNTHWKHTGDLISVGDSISFISNSADSLYINGNVYQSGSTIVTNMIQQSGGNLRLNGKVTNTHPGGHGINKSGGNLYLDSVTIESDGDPIYATSPQTVNVRGTLDINKTLNSNITTNGLYNLTGSTNIGNLRIYNTPTLNNSGTEMLVRNSITGDIEYKDINTLTDIHIVSGNADPSSQQLTLTNSSGGTINISNAASLFTDNDINVTGGTYNPSNGCVSFYTNSGSTFDVCGFATGLTDTNVYNLDGTVGSGRVLTITDSIKFQSKDGAIYGGWEFTPAVAGAGPPFEYSTIKYGNDTFLTKYRANDGWSFGSPDTSNSFHFNTGTHTMSDGWAMRVHANTDSPNGSLILKGYSTTSGSTAFKVVDSSDGHLFSVRDDGAISGTSFYGDGSNLTGVDSPFTVEGDNGVPFTINNGDTLRFVGLDGLDIGVADPEVRIAVDYSGLDSVIMAATNGTGITVDGANDKLLIYDNDAAKVKYINVDQLGSSGGGSSFTGNTSGDCISELWVSSISGCSPVNIGTGLVVDGGVEVNGDLNSTDDISSNTFSLKAPTGGIGPIEVLSMVPMNSQLNINPTTTFNKVFLGDSGIDTDFTVYGDIISSNSGNILAKQLYVEENLAIDWDFPMSAVTLGSGSNHTKIDGDGLTVNTFMSGQTTILYGENNPGSGTKAGLTPTLTIFDNPGTGGGTQNFAGPTIRLSDNGNNGEMFYRYNGGGSVYSNSFNFTSDGGFNFDAAGNSANGDHFFRIAKGQARVTIKERGSGTGKPRTDFRIHNANGGTAYSRLGVGAFNDYWYMEADDVNTPMNIGYEDNGVDTNVLSFTKKNGSLDGSLSIASGLTSNVLNLSTTPTLNNSGTEMLVRNSITGEIGYRDVNTISGGGGGVFTGNTSGDCISELWVSSISGCSPVNIGTGLVVNGDVENELGTGKFVVKNSEEGVNFIEIDGDQNRIRFDESNSGLNLQFNTDKNLGGGTTSFGGEVGMNTWLKVGVGNEEPNEVMLDVNGSTNIVGDVTADKYYGDGSNLTGIGFITGGTFSSSTSTLVLYTKNGEQINVGGFESNGESSELRVGGDDLSSYGNTYFVSPNGDDGTAVMGDVNKPWGTLIGARNQAVSDGLVDSVIYAHTGTYGGCNLQYEGSYYFTPGCKLVGTPQINNGPILGGDQSSRKFIIPSEWASAFSSLNNKLKINGGSNTGVYTVESINDNEDGTTDIIVKENIASNVFDGQTIITKQSLFMLGTTPELDGVLVNNCKIYGSVDVEVSESLDGGWPGGFIETYGESELYAEFGDITQESGSLFTSYDDSKLILKGRDLVLNGGGYLCSPRDNVNMSLDVNSMFAGETTSSWGVILMREGNTSSWNGNLSIKSKEIIREGSGRLLSVRKGTANSKITINGNLTHKGTGDVILSLWNQPGQLNINGNITCNGGAVNWYAGLWDNIKLTVDGDMIKSGTGTTTNFISLNHDFTINGDIYHEDENDGGVSSMIYQTNGTTRVNGKITNLTPSGGGINKAGGDLYLDSVAIETLDGFSVTGNDNEVVNINNSLNINNDYNPSLNIKGIINRDGETNLSLVHKKDDKYFNVFNTETGGTELFNDGLIKIMFNDDNSITSEVLEDPTSGKIHFSWDKVIMGNQKSADVDNSMGSTVINYIDGENDMVNLTVWSPEDNTYPYYEMKITKSNSNYSNLPAVIRVNKWDNI